MNSTRKLLRDRLSISWIALSIVSLIGLFLVPTVGRAQVRTKKPDRGVYQPPLLSDVTAGAVSERKSSQAGAGIADLVRDHQPSKSRPRKRRELVDVAFAEEITPRGDVVEKVSSSAAGEDRSPLRTVGQEQAIFVPPTIGSETIVLADETWSEEAVIWEDGNIIHDGTCDGCPSCDGCDSIGCDSLGCGRTPWYRKWSNSSICCRGDCWFGSVELLLMWRKGDRPPPLVTTGDTTRQENGDTVSNEDQAGQIGQDDTRVLVGGKTILKDLTAGGRFTLGTWLDCQQCRSLVMRGWFAGEERYRFFADQGQFPVLARPFLNVSDGQDPEQDTLLIAFPQVTVDDPDNPGGTITIPAPLDGSVSVVGDSNVFGGDLSVRQFLYGKCGGTIDMLYGYQYMRLNESLGIASTSISLVDSPSRPLGSVLSVADSFKTRNEFHGGQIGMASRYREKCWSFNALFKLGFGSLRRRAKFAGSTLTSIDGANAITPNGLLVRSTNSGATTDHTFAWVPELDLTVGWQQYPNFDVTFGYHIIAMTDALQVSGAIDPDLAVNLSEPPMGQQRPAAILRYNTFYVQGIHFGLQYVY